VVSDRRLARPRDSRLPLESLARGALGVEAGKNATYALMGRTGYEELRDELLATPDDAGSYVLRGRQIGHLQRDEPVTVFDELVQVYGRARIFHDTSDPETGSYLQSQVEALTRHAEGSIMGYDVDGTGSKKAWAVGDAPEKYVDLLKKAIIGVEIEIDRLEGKYKMSQEMGEGDRKGVADGFRALGTEEGEKMAQTVEERAAKKAEARR
jgi:hypothetical protein